MVLGLLLGQYPVVFVTLQLTTVRQSSIKTNNQTSTVVIHQLAIFTTESGQEGEGIFFIAYCFAGLHSWQCHYSQLGLVYKAIDKRGGGGDYATYSAGQGHCRCIGPLSWYPREDGHTRTACPQSTRHLIVHRMSDGCTILIDGRMHDSGAPVNTVTQARQGRE